MALVWNCCLAFAAYILFAGQISLSEGITGAFVAILVALWACATTHYTRMRFAFTAEDLAIAARAVGQLPRKLAKSFVALADPTSDGGRLGNALSAPFEIGVIEDCRERSRRAFAVLAASLAPDSFIIRADVFEGEVLIHTIVQEGTPDQRSLL